MRYFYLLCLLFTSQPLFLQAQQEVKLSVYFGGNYSYINAAPTEFATTLSSFHSIEVDANGDTSTIYAQKPYLQTTNHSFDVKPGGEVGLRLQFPLKKIANGRLSIQTAFGFSSITYQPSNNSASFEPDPSRETTYTTTPFNTVFVPTNIFGNNCDTLISGNFTSFPTPTHDLVFLHLPLNLSYQAIPKILDLNAGLFLRTPIFTQETSTRIATERQEHTDNDGFTYTECRQISVRHVDRAGARFRDLLLGVNLGVDYHFGDQFSISLQASRVLTPFQNIPASGSFSLNSSSMRPFINQGAIHLYYHFVKKEK